MMMRRWQRAARAGAIACAFAATTAGASAAKAFEADGSVPGSFGPWHPEATARVAVGQDFALGPLPLIGGGLGTRVGVSFRGFYGGLTYMDYFTEESCGNGGMGGCGSLHGESFGLEGGFGLTFFRILIIRAQLGLGDYVLTSNWTTPPANCPPPPSAPCSTAPTLTHASNNALYFQPGGLVEVALGPFLIGIDASWFFLPQPPPPSTVGGQSYGAFMLGAQLGIRL